QFKSLLLDHSSTTQMPLWQQVTTHGHQMALLLAEKVKHIPEIQITQKVEANSVFATIPKSWLKPLRETLFFYVWDEKTYAANNQYEVRWMMSFDTTSQDIENFIQCIHALK